MGRKEGADMLGEHKEVKREEVCSDQTVILMLQEQQRYSSGWGQASVCDGKRGWPKPL